VEESNRHRAEVRRLKEEQLKQMPEDIRRKYVCRYYMAGNCHCSREDCFYVHAIEDLRYDRQQLFLPGFRQPPKSKEDKTNYLSLHRYYQQHRRPEDPELSLEDINAKYGHKETIRRRVHL
jgi:hypothetical protein